MIVWSRVREIVAEHGAAALVSVHEVKGSVPRDAGARMIVRPDGAFHGTIGGGQLEWGMLAAAREALSKGRGPARFVQQTLGPDLGQCCGGRVTMLVETFDRRDAKTLAVLAEAEGDGAFEVACSMDGDGRVRRQVSPSPLAGEGREGGAGVDARSGDGPNTTVTFRAASDLPPSPSLPHKGGEGRGRWREVFGDDPTPLYLFGAGHVGRALVLALAPLPFVVRWLDSRREAFPSHVPSNVTPVEAPHPVAEIGRAPADAFVLVMTHEHPLDLAITAAALQKNLPFVGLIGSKTKRARFEKRFRELAIPQERIRALVCPIGLPGIGGKEPAIIAAATVAQLLAERERLAVPSRSRTELQRSHHDHAFA